MRALAVFAACAAVTLALLVSAGRVKFGSFDALDTIVLTWVRARTGGTGVEITLARGVTTLGETPTLWIVTLAAAGALLAARRGRAAAQLLGVAASGGLLTTMIKTSVGRLRPSVVERLVATSSASFPSGHAMNSAFVYGAIALIAASAARTRRGQVWVVGAALMLIVAIGASRVVLGVHWPSDVLAGWAIGALWAALGATLAQRIADRAALRLRSGPTRPET